MRTELSGRWAVGLLGVALAVFLGWLALRPGAGGADPETAARRVQPPALDPAALDRVPFPLEHVIRRGETLDDVLRRAGVPEAELGQARRAVSKVLDPRKLRAHDFFYSMVHRDEGLVAIRLPRNGQGVVVADRDSGGVWTSHYRPYRRSHVRRLVSGELRGALETAIRQAGGPGRLAGHLAEVLQWDIDFNRDLRAGDRFEILFDELLLDGQVQGIVGIQALRYRGRDRLIEAYRFAEGGAGVGSDGYYDADGQPLRRQFLRSPLRYSRVTSRFSLSRFHPILKRRMPHYGVDYGAPVGTQVRATASGTVVSAGTRGGGGRTVRVRHANGYLTAYLHLSGYAPGIRAGARVDQGEVIGYVGSSGLSTGPHLDYRVQHNGRWINPATLESTPVPPLADAVLPDFLEHRDALRRQLDGAPVRAARLGP